MSESQVNAGSGPKVVYISHGGGPLPLLGDPSHEEMLACLKALAKELPRPEAIVVVSAHWEEWAPHVTSAEQPELIYDYYGFPPESYEIQYPARGQPSLAASIAESLAGQSIECVQDAKRGFDHGLFVPLKIMYPDADIPCVQLSLVKHLDPEFHIKLGVALQSLPSSVLVMGSGFSFHNMREFFSSETEETKKMNENFQLWLQQTCLDEKMTEEERWERLANWSGAPHATYCHPREEHLLPLHVCYGAARRAAVKHYSLKILNKSASMFMW